MLSLFIIGGSGKIIEEHSSGGPALIITIWYNDSKLEPIDRRYPEKL